MKYVNFIWDVQIWIGVLWYIPGLYFLLILFIDFIFFFFLVLWAFFILVIEDLMIDACSYVTWDDIIGLEESERF